MAIRLRWPTDANAYLETLQLFEVFAFRVYRWAGRRADAGQTRLFRLGFDLYHRTAHLPDVSREVRQMGLLYSPDRAFREGFEAADDNSFYLWWHPLLSLRIRRASGKRSWCKDELGTTRKKRSAKTVEHVLPQQPKDKYWTDRFDKPQRRKLTHHIGNLTLTFDNSVYGNKPYPTKRGDLKSVKPCYATSNLFTEQSIAKEFDDWTEDALLERGERIRDWALERWKIDSSGLAPIDENELLEDEAEPEVE
jgi:hypothetical protein